MCTQRKIPIFIFSILTVTCAHAETREEMEQRAQIDLQKCYDLPSTELAQKCITDLVYKNAPPDTNPEPISEPQNNNGRLVFRCNVPSFKSTRMGASFTIWTTKSKSIYSIVSENNPSVRADTKGFGTPGKGSVGLTFPDGAKLTITESGWTSTNLDKVRNKNSLYGATSSEPNTAPGQCVYVSN